MHAWEIQVETLLASHNLLRYITRDAPANVEKRFMVQQMLINTIRKSAVVRKMRAEGWDPSEINPYDTYRAAIDAMRQMEREMIAARIRSG